MNYARQYLMLVQKAIRDPIVESVVLNLRDALRREIDTYRSLFDLLAAEGNFHQEDVERRIKIADRFYWASISYLRGNKKNEKMFDAIDYYLRGSARFLETNQNAVNCYEGGTVGGSEELLHMITITRVSLRSLDQLGLLKFIKRAKPDLERFIEEFGVVAGYRENKIY